MNPLISQPVEGVGPVTDPRAILLLLDHLGRATEAGVEVDGVLEVGLARLLELLGASHGAVYVKDPTSGGLNVRSWIGRDVQRDPIPRGPPAHRETAIAPLRSASSSSGDFAARRERDAIGPDAMPTVHRELAEGRAVLVDAAGSATPAGRELDAVGIGAALLMPLRTGGETIGALVVCPPQDHSLGEPERELAVASGSVLALVLRNAQLFAGLQERARELDRKVRELMALSEVARAVAGSLDSRAVQRTIVREARRLVRADVAVLLEPDGSGEMVRSASEGLREGEPIPWGPTEFLDGPTVGVSLRGGRTREPLGALLVARRRREPFSAGDLERLGGLADQATVALANAELLSDLRREKEERQALAEALMEAQEQERRRIAEEIHDGPVQELVGLGLILDAVVTDLRRSGAGSAAGEVAAAAGAARHSVTSLRQAIFDLHPIALDELGFAAAARPAVKRLEEQGMLVRMNVDSLDELPRLQRFAAFRIMQEALQNIARHAGADEVRIEATREDAVMRVSIMDDGRGFDLAAAKRRLRAGHLGLAAMRKRADVAGGSLEIDTAPGEGTALRLELPIRVA